MLAVPLWSEAPPLPSSYFGVVTTDGAPAPAGAEISAWLAGTAVAATSSVEGAGETRYRLDVPGDRAETPEIEGPREGDVIELRLGGAILASVSWSSGAYRRLDLAAAGGPDLAVAISNSAEVVTAGESLEYRITIRNEGPATSREVVVEVDLPAGLTGLAASDGGELSAGSARWPSIELSAGTSATRSLTVRVDDTHPAGITLLEVVARVADDGSGGLDPDPSNNRASDLDELLAAPELAVHLDDGKSTARPGEHLVYRATITNHGSQGASGVALSVRPPAMGIELLAASHGAVVEGSEIRWPDLELGAGELAERTFTVRVAENLDPAILELTAAAEVKDDGENGPESSQDDNRSDDVDQVTHAADLAVARVDVAGVTTDPQTLALAGEVEVTVDNRGTLPSGPHWLTLFSDEDLDGTYTVGVDRPLAEWYHVGLAAQESAVVVVEISGEARFRGDRLFAMADSHLEVDEIDETNNVGDSSASCDAVPSGVFTPVVEGRWPLAGGPSQFTRAIDSLSTPLVVHLTDDNGDGRFDERDVPSLVFVTADLVYPLEPMQALRAVRGDSLAPIFDVTAIYPQPILPLALSLSGLAAADIDRDGKPEIVSTTFIASNRLIAFEHTGAIKWQSQAYRTHSDPSRTTRSDNPTIADLDGDDNAEIVVGANVFDRFGQLLWRGTGGHAFQSASNQDDHRSGAISAVADVDLDGRLEVVTGNTLYRHDGSIVWQLDLPDGFPAVGNFDADPEAEIVVVARGTVRLHDTDGTLLWGPLTLPGSNPEAGGAPTVGDFDGDGLPEIGVAGSDVYVVHDTDGALLWQASTQDYTSNFTGSTLYDFDGDGRMEVVYRDERHLWIFRGADGAVLYRLPVSSDTWTEMPVVADVDGDGAAEIVVSSDRALSVSIPSGGRTAGLFVVGDGGDGWVSARGLWNQHAYAPELVADDAGVPPRPDWGWLDHNSFRANVSPAGGAFGSADLTASRLGFDLSALPLVGVTARIGNGGRAASAPGLLVAVYLGDPAAGGALVGTLATDRRLAPGELVDLSGDFEPPFGTAAELFVVADDDGTGSGRELECNETNNVASLPLDLTALGLWITLDDGTDGVGAGDELTYRIAVRNALATAATGVTVTDELPAELLFVAASDGGVEAGGVVTWPAFTLASGGLAERTLTVRVDPDLPLAVTSITNRAHVGDDGAAGPDPTPANNTAIDVDRVLTATAEAGGPYSGVEGAPVLFDGSASFDRDGTLVAYEWDLDDDGEFDDASGPTATWTFADDGLHRVRLRVRDDSGETDVDAAEVAIANVPPVVSAPETLAADEGSALSLAAVTVADPGTLDALVAAIDWGDGTVETIPVATGSLAASHVYIDDGDYPLAICVADGDGGESCVAVAAAIANAPPEIEESLDFDLLGWTGEEPAGATTVSWQIGADGATAVETKNGRPTALIGDLPAFGVHEFLLRVATSSDDDFIGFVLGIEPGDLASPAADFLIVDWKGRDQSGARAGLALSRVHGTPSDAEYWLHADLDANGSQHRVVELARGATLGRKGWRRHTDHHVRVDYRASRLRVWVDGQLELDVPGEFPAGRLGFYDHSQSYAVFTPIASTLAVSGAEGEPAALRAAYSDAGVADTHRAEIDWGDGTLESVPLASEEGHGEVRTAHTFRDDGSSTLELCVEDDDLGAGCASIPVHIENRPPILTFDLRSSGYREDVVDLGTSSFTDPGVDDVHTATIDWGDGALETVSVVESSGSGTLAAGHLYAAEGVYEVELCIDDGDGGVACEARTLTLVDRFLDLALTKSVSPREARPSQNVLYTLRVENRGSLPSTGIVISDVLPEYLSFVSATGGGIATGESVRWGPMSLEPGAARSFTLTARIAGSAPFGAVVVNSATVSDDGVAGQDGQPLDNSASALLRISDASTPIVSLASPLSGSEGTTLSLANATWGDTTTGETHTATIDWGDGTTTAGGLSPSTGTSGKITGAHVYADNGIYALAVCVRDAAGHVGCGTTPVTVGNLPPVVVEPGLVDMRGWLKEEYPSSDVTANWAVASDGLSVTQTRNSTPSIFVSPLPAFGTTLEGILRVGSAGSWDNDYIGFVLGFDEGDVTNPEAEYLLIDWKQGDQNVALRGLALSRVFGIPLAGELWGHRNVPDNGLENGVQELSRGLTLSRTGWLENRDYRLRFEYAPDRLRVWVDDVLQFDLEGTFPSGRFGFYNYSQQDVRYRGFVVGLSQRLEGERFDLVAPFSDLGEVDTHVARIDWDDGTQVSLGVPQAFGYGTVVAAHDYLEDGDYSIEVCVTDDDDGADCGRFPLLVLNVAPTVVAASDAVASAGVVTNFDLATFTDPGRLDSHTATVDWGDGTVEPATVTEDDGAGEVAASHAYAAAGLYTVTICVLDDDGGEGCDATRIAVGSELPLLVAPKTVTSVDRDGDGRVSPGDDLVYAIEIVNLGPTPATGVVLTDPIPAHTTLLAETVTPEALVTGLDPLTVELPAIAAGESIAVGFAVRIDAVLPLGVNEIANQGVVTSAELAPVATDDPALPGAADPTRIPVYAASRFRFEKRAELVDLDGNGIATAGDELVWTLELTNVGTTEAAGLLVRDAVPNDSELVAGSLVTTGLVTRDEPVEIVFDQLAVGATETVELRTRIADPLPRATSAIVNQAELWVGELAEQLSDDPSTEPGGDATSVAVAPVPDLTVAPASVAEGNAGTTSLRFRLVLDVPTVFPVSIAWATADQTALAGEEYVAAAGIASFAPGATEAFVDVTILGDLVVEADETLRLVLSQPSRLRLVTAEAIGTILNDDRTFFGLSDAEAEEGELLTFLVRLSAPSALGAAVDYSTADGTATAGADYVATASRLVFAPFEMERPVVVETIDDTELEDDETLRLVLSSPAIGELAQPEAIGTIRDNDDARLSIDDVEVDEGDEGTAPMRFTVSLPAPVAHDVAVDYATVAETATAGSDFEPVAGTLTIRAGEPTGTIEVPIVGDLFFESDETLRVELSNPGDAILERGVGIGTIRDDDLCRGPNLLVNGSAELVTWKELFPGWTSPDGSRWQRRTSDPAPLAGTACFDAADLATAELAQTVDLARLAERIDAGDLELALSGWVRTADESPSDLARVVVELHDATGTALLDSWDSGPLATAGAWAPFEHLLELPFAARRLRFRLLGARQSGAELDACFDALAVEPLKLPLLTVSDVEVFEAPGAEAPFAIALSCQLEDEVSFGYATAEGTARAVEDYQPTSGAGAIPPGDLAATVAVPIVDDETAEPTEQFTLGLHAAAGAELFDPIGVGTIRDDDGCQGSSGYWKGHAALWPSQTLVMGGVLYDADAIAVRLATKGNNPSARVAAQLVATLFNLLIGSDPSILPVVEQADAFLALYPPGTAVGEPQRIEAEWLVETLDDYNTSCKDK